MKATMLNMFAYTVFVLMSASIILSCKSEELLTKGKVFFEATASKNYSLEDQAQLNELIAVLAKEPNVIEIVEDARVVDLTDSRGDFKAIAVQYQSGGKNIKMIVPIVERSGTGNAYYTLSDENCNMKCISNAPNAECNLRIIERCKSLNGSFSEGKGSCSTVVAFNDEVTRNTILRAHAK